MFQGGLGYWEEITVPAAGQSENPNSILMVHKKTRPVISDCIIFYL
jgi:hypothetical protein